jgi:hypothetical protein
MKPAGGRYSVEAKNSSAIPTGETICYSMSTSTETTAPGSAPATRPDWTGVVAGLIEIFGKLDAQTFLQAGVQASREAAFGREKERV